MVPLFGVQIEVRECFFDRTATLRERLEQSPGHRFGASIGQGEAYEKNWAKKPAPLARTLGADNLRTRTALEYPTDASKDASRDTPMVVCLDEGWCIAIDAAPTTQRWTAK